MDINCNLKSLNTNFFVLNIAGTDGIRNLLLGWTGWPELPEEYLRVAVVEPGDVFAVQTCFMELQIPRDYDKIKVYDALDLLVKNNSGFGVI